MDNPRMRAADVDRELVVSFLQTQVGAGRLSLDEFSERSAAAYRACTMRDLDALTEDLPAPASPAAPRVIHRPHPAFVPTVVAGLAVIVLLGAALTMLIGMRDAGPMGHIMDHMGQMMGR